MPKILIAEPLAAAGIELLRAQALCRTVALEAPEGTGGEGEHAGCFNVRKDGSDEADIWLRLFRVEF